MAPIVRSASPRQLSHRDTGIIVFFIYCYFCAAPAAKQASDALLTLTPKTFHIYFSSLMKGSVNKCVHLRMAQRCFNTSPLRVSFCVFFLFAQLLHIGTWHAGVVNCFAALRFNDSDEVTDTVAEAKRVRVQAFPSKPLFVDIQCCRARYKLSANELFSVDVCGCGLCGCRSCCALRNSQPSLVLWSIIGRSWSPF